MNSLPYTDALMDMVEDGIVDKDFLILSFCKWLGEAGVREFCRENEYIMHDPAHPDQDGDHASALVSAGWGTDEDYGYYGDAE